MLNPFYFIPVRDSFKDIHYQAVTLRAPPTLARILFILETIVTLIIFALSYYYSATTSTTETTISFEVLASPYSCDILSPRSDSYTYGTDNSELVQFSDARLTYSDCVTYLGSEGYDVCNTNRDDYLLEIIGIGNDDSTDYSCLDILLSNGYRLCYGSQETYTVDNAQMSTSFTTQTYSTATKYSNVYYFMNSSSHIYPLVNGIDRTAIYTDYITDIKENVFVVGKSSSSGTTTVKTNLFQLNPTYTTTKTLMDVGAGSIYGITYGDSTVFVFTVEQNMQHIYAYNTTKKTTTVSSITCSTSTGTSGGYGTRYISWGTDNKLYVICDANTASANSQSFSFLRVNPYTFTTTTLTASIASHNYTDSSGAVSSKIIDKVSQVLFVNNALYFICNGVYSNILSGHLIGPSTTVTGITNLGVYDGTYATLQSIHSIYFPGGNYSYYNTTANKILQYSTTTFRPSYYHTIAMELAYRYQICNTNLTSYTIAGDTSASFRRKCWQINGFYYQNNIYIDVPTSCSGAITMKSQAKNLLSCSAVATAQSTFLTNTCSTSYDKVCDQEYTENPPFSCTKDTYPTTLTNLSTSFANASAAFSFMVLFFRILMKIFYPHGCTEYDYDPVTERYLPHGTLTDAKKASNGKIHAMSNPVDVEAVLINNNNKNNGNDQHFTNPRDLV